MLRLPLAGLALVMIPGIAAAQVDRYADDPTTAIDHPVSGLAGEPDATTVSLNPAGLVFLGGWHLALTAFDLGPNDEIVGLGSGYGFYGGVPVDLPLLPKLGFGFAVEKWLPPRVALATDPGDPLRFSLAGAFETGGFGLGLSWHHFVDENGGALDGLDTLDIGTTFRLGSRWATGLVVRDLLGPAVAGLPVQRRYDFEIVSRPFATDRLEVGARVAFGERRLDTDARLRVSLRIVDGVWLRGAYEVRELWKMRDPGFPAGSAERVFDYRGTLGLEVSLGQFGIGGFATAGRGDVGEGFYGLASSLRWSGEDLPSAIRRPPYIERLRLEGSLSDRKLTRTILHLRTLERDDSARGLFLMIDGLAIGFAGAQELRDAIFRLRERGKRVFVYLFTGGTRDYYIASAADRIYLDGAGGLRLVGISSTVLFFKLMFDYLGIEAQFEKIDEYKSAPEAFTRFESSEEARRMRDWLFDDLWHQLVMDVARDRRMLPAAVQQAVDGGPYTAAEARSAGLVDDVVEPDQLDAIIAKEMGKDYRFVDPLPRPRADSWELPQIAIVFLDGDIVDGKSVKIPIIGRRLSGGDTIAQAIAAARKSPRVKAIVLRVDSPGGSALASEVIWREVHKTRGVKPIIVSMGDIAASGGYFAAAAGDVIFAHPSTFTGSIGIFTGKFDLSYLLSRVGLRWETTTRGRHADMGSTFRGYTADERRAIKDKLRYYYDRFRTAVTKGRPLTMEQVDAVGRGQVFTGNQAKEHKLVDQLGGLAEAISEAKRRAGFQDDDALEVVMLPSEGFSLLEQLLEMRSADAEVRPGPLEELLRGVPASLLVGRDVPQARLPFDLVWDD